MEHCKWDFKLFNHYFRFTKRNVFLILGNREGQWKEIINIQF